MTSGKILTEKNRLPPRVRQALDETGLEWTVESCSTGWKIRLAGRMIQTLPSRRDINICHEKPILATIRRAAREITSARS